MPVIDRACGPRNNADAVKRDVWPGIGLRQREQRAEHDGNWYQNFFHFDNLLGMADVADSRAIKLQADAHAG